MKKAIIVLNVINVFERVKFVQVPDSYCNISHKI